MCQAKPYDMLRLVARFVPGLPYETNDYLAPGAVDRYRSTGHWPTATKLRPDMPYSPVGQDAYPLGTTVKQALGNLCERGLMHNCQPGSPFRTWVDDPTGDGGEGDDVECPCSPVMYSMQRYQVCP